MTIRADNDNRQAAAGMRRGASATALFMPVAVFAGSCAALLLWLDLRAPGNVFVARAALAVLVLGVPALMVRAILRLLTTSLQPVAQGLCLHRGFPLLKPVSVPWQAIRRVRVRTGIGGYLFGSGTLVCELHDGRKFAIRDIENVQSVKTEIGSVMESRRVHRSGPRGRRGFHPPAVAG